MEKIFVWGTGNGAIQLNKFLDTSRIIGYVDTYSTKKEFMGKPLYRPKELSKMEYDAVLVAVGASEAIKNQAANDGIDSGKMIYLYNHLKCLDLNGNYDFAVKILSDEAIRRIKNSQKVVSIVNITDGGFLNDCPLSSPTFESDFVRYKSFELCVREIRARHLTGSVAEVGVFQGDFAQYINFAFPDKKCYLFDTFEGFDENEAKKEMASGNIDESFCDFFRNTGVELVLNKMVYRDKVVIKQGLFPKSLNGLEDKFCFVSIDVDLEDSIYECMKYFYPRLLPGGYIFVHDYNSTLFGVRKAIDRLETEMKISLAKVPLVDECGTLVVTK